MTEPSYNPWAAPALNGFNTTSPDNCDDVDHAFVWPENEGFQPLTANQQLSVAIVLDDGNDFRLQALIWTLQGQDEELNTPGFLYRIQDDAGNYISDGYIYCYATPGTWANPWPMFPHVTYSSHRRIQFDIINLNNGLQGVQFIFRGMKRFQRGA